MTQLEVVGFDPFFAAELELLAEPSLVAARVAADGRDVFPLLGCTAAFGELSGKLRQQITEKRGARPVVGDWVAIKEQGDHAVIHHVLDRRTQLDRRAAGSDSVAQTIAANVDVFFVVTAAGRDLNPRRIERYVAAVWQSGAAPIVVLNKIDVAPDLGLLRGLIEEVAPNVPVIAASAHQGSGLDELRALLGPGRTAAFIGSSGVGKSSLVNCLLGQNQQSTSAVGADGRGSHTTTRRELLLLAEGGILIDTPGLREFGLVDVERGLRLAFTDIAELAAGCRFGDCTHLDEPGCAVKAAVASGILPSERLDGYRRLRKEAAAAERRQDPLQAGNSKRRMKAIAKNIRAFTKSRRQEE